MKLTLRDAPRIVMGLLYVALGINHFWHPAFYTHIMPLYVPAHLALVHLSGIAEILLGLGVCIEATRRPAAWLIIAMLITFLLVHVDMIQHADRFKEIHPIALWIRLPLQALLIYWAWRYTRPNTSATTTATPMPPASNPSTAAPNNSSSAPRN